VGGVQAGFAPDHTTVSGIVLHTIAPFAFVRYAASVVLLTKSVKGPSVLPPGPLRHRTPLATEMTMAPSDVTLSDGLTQRPVKLW
jgi:hypothetical protein